MTKKEKRKLKRLKRRVANLETAIHYIVKAIVAVAIAADQESADNDV